MVVKWIKRIIWLFLMYVIWKEVGAGTAILFLFIAVVSDFFALFMASKLAIKGFQEGNSPEDIMEAQDRFIEYQRNPFSQSKPLVTFSQIVLAPVCSLGIPFILAGYYLGWYS